MDAVLASLARHDIAFDVTVCGADVASPKPHPEPYQRAAALIGDAARPDEEDIWFIIENAAGDPVGYVAVGAFDEDATGTIMHIGVVAGQRGHHYIDQLLRLANRAARSRGWAGMLSDVDVRNSPMLAAMARNGHRADLRPWHKWMYRRVAG